MKPYRTLSEMFWRPDTAIDELRSRSGWTEFHREAGKRGFYFDLMFKDGKRYKHAAFTVTKTTTGGWAAQFLAEGAGKTPLEAFEAVYLATGRTCPELDALMLRVKGVGVADTPSVEIVKPPVEEIDHIFDNAVEESEDEFDALFG